MIPLQPEVVPPLQQYLLIEHLPAVLTIQCIMINNQEKISLRVENPVYARVDTHLLRLRVVLDKAIEL